MERLCQIGGTYRAKRAACSKPAVGPLLSDVPGEHVGSEREADTDERRPRVLLRNVHDSDPNVFGMLGRVQLGAREGYSGTCCMRARGGPQRSEFHVWRRKDGLACAGGTVLTPAKVHDYASVAKPTLLDRRAGWSEDGSYIRLM